MSCLFEGQKWRPWVALTHGALVALERLEAGQFATLGYFARAVLASAEASDEVRRAAQACRALGIALRPGRR